MTTGRFRKAVARRPASSLDSGFTLIELLVSALITSILLAIIIAPLVSVTDTANTTESVSQAAAATTAAVESMSAAVTSASEICVPTQVTPSANQPSQAVAAGYAVRVLTTAFSSTGTTEWEQWWVDSTGQLDAQTWPFASTQPTTWRVVTAGIAATTGATPFAITIPASSTTPVVLTITLTASAGVKATAVSTPVTSSIAALNTAYLTGSGTCSTEVS